MKLNKDGFEPGQILTEKQYTETINKQRAKAKQPARKPERKKVRTDENSEE